MSQQRLGSLQDAIRVLFGRESLPQYHEPRLHANMDGACSIAHQSLHNEVISCRCQTQR